jgi:hypothetical protein
MLNEHQVSELEVRLDNEVWIELRNTLLDIDWPAFTEPTSLRLFMIIRDN